MMSISPLMKHNEVKQIHRIEQMKLPEDCQMLVNFTLDFDAMILRTHLQEPPLWRTQGEFGGRVGMWRLLDLFNREQIKTTIFLPGYTGILYPDVIRHAVDTGHELANHMWKHYIPDTKIEEAEHIANTDNLIKEFTGEYPAGTRSQHDLSLLGTRKYLYYSYFPMGNEPFYVFNNELNDWILNIPMDIVHDDAMYFYFGWFGSSNNQQRLESSDVFLDVLIQSFRRSYKTSRYMNICLHPNITGRSMRMLMLEKFINEIKTYKGVVCETSKWLASHIIKNHPM